MHLRVKLCCLLGAVVAWGMSGSAAQAQFGGNGFYLYNLPQNLYGNGNDSIPFYSLHPPVYYSMPVPRTYGYSPFAYPPGFMTPEILPAEPKVMLNPHAPRRSSPKRTGERVTMSPRIIVNPYVAQTRHSSNRVAIREAVDPVEPAASGSFEADAGL
ncbi:MAG TPA: hypothetical protein VND64_16825 [Pirellulales bacterium]|nr:hypothetical protein [Pirellulales bacterium]